MRAVWYDENGRAPQVLHVGNVPTPEPGPGEVRVRLATSGVNPIDVKRRLGARGQVVRQRTIPHFDGAGIIDAVGEGVPPARISERVWVFEAQWKRAFGTAAESVVVPTSRAVRLPDNVSFVEAACLGIPALTAHRAVFADGPVAGQTVLVTGGAGAVGAYAVQFAKLGGARVLATVSGREKAEIAADAGADYVFNYKTEDVVERVMNLRDGGGLDRIVEVEFGGNLPATLRMLKPNGVIAAYASDAVLEPKVPFYTLAYVSGTVRFVVVFVMPEPAKEQAIADINGWLKAGALRHYVAKPFALEETAAAHELVERGSLGNVVVEISPGG
jgi:NADPH2:quinone reductase